MFNLDKFTYTVKKYLVAIDQGNDDFALFFLLLASFVYGVVHALGPGHGKALAFSYFSAQKSSYIKALSISFATAFIHIVGAFVLVVFSIFILQNVLGGFIQNSIDYITNLAAILIMLLSLYILYRKLNKKSYSCSCCNSNIDTTLFVEKPNKDYNILQTTNIKQDFASKHKNRQDLFFVLTAGLVPCPGTVLLFTYAFLLKTYFSVLLASIFISLGMSVVIFASSFLGVSLNKVSAKSKKLTNILEIIAPIFMFLLGLLLLLNF